MTRCTNKPRQEPTRERKQWQKNIFYEQNKNSGLGSKIVENNRESVSRFSLRQFRPTMRTRNVALTSRWSFSHVPRIKSSNVTSLQQKWIGLGFSIGFLVLVHFSNFFFSSVHKRLANFCFAPDFACFAAVSSISRRIPC